MENYRIRPATIQDIPSIQDLYLLEEAHHRALYPDYFCETSQIIPAQVLAHEIQEPNSIYLVAIRETTVIGFIYVKKGLFFSSEPQFKKMEYASVEDCVVREEYRRQGLGTALVQAAQKWVEEQGLSRLQLQVWAKNKPAIQLYRRLGFKKLIVRMEWNEEGRNQQTETT